jgi:hypothetical protein
MRLAIATDNVTQRVLSAGTKYAQDLGTKTRAVRDVHGDVL